MDNVTGGVWYYKAPSKFLGNNSDVYGKSLKFDLKITPLTNMFKDKDVILEGGGLTIWYHTDKVPGTNWTSYSVTLKESGWKSGQFNAGKEVSSSDFKKVLANMTALYIRGEYNSGADTGSMDNVKFGN